MKRDVTSASLSNTKRLLFGALLLVFVGGVLSACATDSESATSVSDLPVVTMYKSPTCGCCAKWAEHLEAHGFEVTAIDLPDVTPLKQRYGVPRDLASCHTAVVGGYVMEGHVPAEDVKRLLAEKPDVVGLAVPGMPIGSPGMEGPNPKPYDVVAFTRGGERGVFASR